MKASLQRLALGGVSLDLSGAGLGLQGGLRLFDQAAKSNGVGDRNFRKLTTIELNISGLEAFNKAAVAHTRLAAGSIETHDPKATHVGLLLLAIDVSVLPSVLHRLLGVAKQLGFVTEIAFGVFQDFFATLTRRGSISCTRHVLYLVLVPVGRLVRIHPPGGVGVERDSLPETGRQAAEERRSMARSHQLVARGTSFGLRAFRGQQVTETRRAADQLTRTGYFEALGDGLFCLLHEESGAKQRTPVRLASVLSDK